MKIALMADSTGYLPQDFMDQYEIPIAPLSVAFDDGETFTENDNAVSYTHLTLPTNREV